MILDAFTDYNEYRLPSSIGYLPHREFRRRFLTGHAVRARFEVKEMGVALDDN